MSTVVAGFVWMMQMVPIVVTAKNALVVRVNRHAATPVAMMYVARQARYAVMVHAVILMTVVTAVKAVITVHVWMMTISVTACFVRSVMTVCVRTGVPPLDCTVTSAIVWSV
ncbi:MAG TPA: hypothetical protein HPP87_07125 [Planctomycetes bacterium]|nr:hypothetical protein [Planctomycetota bacterium]